MPVLLDVDDSESDEEVIAVGPGTMRRKSPGEGKEWMQADGTANGEDKKKVGNTSSKANSRSRKR
jgi:COMPASS component SWD1